MVAPMLATQDELFLQLYYDQHAKDGKVHVPDRFFTVRQPKSGNAEGLFDCFKNALSLVGLANWEDKLIGFGCDGTSVNIAPRAVCALGDCILVSCTQAGTVLKEGLGTTLFLLQMTC